MTCEFFNTLTPEQRASLRKLLEAEETPQYRVEVEFWDKEKTKIKYLCEYLGNKKHGMSCGWYENGKKRWETGYQNGQLHGKETQWNKNGKKYLEIEYRNGKMISEKRY